MERKNIKHTMKTQKTIIAYNYVINGCDSLDICRNSESVHSVRIENTRKNKR